MEDRKNEELNTNNLIYRKIINNGNDRHNRDRSHGNLKNYSNNDYNNKHQDNINSNSSNRTINNFIQGNSNTHNFNRFGNANKFNDINYRRLREAINSTFLNKQSETIKNEEENANSNVYVKEYDSFPRIKNILRNNHSFITDTSKPIKVHDLIDQSISNENKLNFNLQNISDYDTVVRVMPNQSKFIPPTRKDLDIIDKLERINDDVLDFHIKTTKYFNKIIESNEYGKLKEIYDLIDGIRTDINSMKLSKTEDMFNYIMNEIHLLSKHINDTFEKELDKNQKIFSVMTSEYFKIKYDMETKFEKYEKAMKTHYEGVKKLLINTKDDELIKYVKNNMTDFDVVNSNFEDQDGLNKNNNDNNNEKVDKKLDNMRLAKLNNDPIYDALNATEINEIDTIGLKSSNDIEDLVNQGKFVIKMIDKDVSIHSGINSENLKAMIIKTKTSVSNQTKNWIAMRRIENSLYLNRLIKDNVDLYVKIKRYDKNNFNSNNMDINIDMDMDMNMNEDMNMNMSEMNDYIYNRLDPLNKLEKLKLPISLSINKKRRLKAYFFTYIANRRMIKLVIQKRDYLCTKSFDYFMNEFSNSNNREDIILRSVKGVVFRKIPQISLFSLQYSKNPKILENMPDALSLHSVVSKIFDEFINYYDNVYNGILNPNYSDDNEHLDKLSNDDFNKLKGKIDDNNSNNIKPNENIQNNKNNSNIQNINKIDDIYNIYDYDIPVNIHKYKGNYHEFSDNLYEDFLNKDKLTKFHESKIPSILKLIISDSSSYPYTFFYLYELSRLLIPRNASIIFSEKDNIKTNKGSNKAAKNSKNNNDTDLIRLKKSKILSLSEKEKEMKIDDVSVIESIISKETNKSNVEKKNEKKSKIVVLNEGIHPYYYDINTNTIKYEEILTFKNNKLLLSAQSKKFILINLILLKSFLHHHLKELSNISRNHENNIRYLKLLLSIIYHLVKDYYKDMFPSNTEIINKKNEDKLAPVRLLSVEEISKMVKEQVITKSFYFSNFDFSNIRPNEKIYTLHLLPNDNILAKLDKISNRDFKNVDTLKYHYNMNFYERKKIDVLEKFLEEEKLRLLEEQTRIEKSKNDCLNFFSDIDVELKNIDNIFEIENIVFNRDYIDDYFKEFKKLRLSDLSIKIKELEDVLMNLAGE